MICRIWDTMRGMSPSVGSSSRMIFGSSIIARAIASICCSPPENLPPRWSRRPAPLGEDGKIGVDLVQELLLARLRPAAAVEPGAQVLHHGQQAEDAAVLGNVADAEPRQPMGGQARDRLPFEQHIAPARVD